MFAPNCWDHEILLKRYDLFAILYLIQNLLYYILILTFMCSVNVALYYSNSAGERMQCNSFGYRFIRGYFWRHIFSLMFLPKYFYLEI